MKYAEQHGLEFAELIKIIRYNQFTRSHWKTYRGTDYVQVIFDNLFEFRGTTEEFREGLALIRRTGNTQEVINFIRSRLAVNYRRENIIPSTATVGILTRKIKTYFIALLQPQATFTGFRLNLVSCVRLAVFLRLGKKDLDGVCIDLWGDGLQLGGRDVTRLGFRIIDKSITEYSSQCSKMVFIFAAFYGKDNRYNMEENVGWSTIGDQTTAWLYQQTRELHSEGVKIVISGDSPYVSRLIVGVSNDDSAESRMAAYVPKGTNFTTDEVDSRTFFRTDVIVPFWTELPRTSLVYIESVGQICPDPTHLLIRCAEFDLARMAKLLIARKSPYDEKPVAILERNLNDREVKAPHFHFVINKKDKNEATVASLSFSGRDAICATADLQLLQEPHRHAEDMLPSAEVEIRDERDICELYEGVWTNEVTNDIDSQEVKALKSLGYASLFDKDVNGNVSPADGHFALLYDLSELLRSSLWKCSTLLRSKTKFEKEQFKNASETYYQVSKLLFGSKGISPYKAKLMIIPQLIEKGYIELPYNHMTEAGEHSNHRANKVFHTKTMRGGGTIFHEDPLYLDMLHDFCSLMSDSYENAASAHLPQGLEQRIRDCYTVVRQTLITPNFEDVETYVDICQKPLPKAERPEQPVYSEYPLIGMRFVFIGTMNSKHEEKKQSIATSLGAEIFSHDQALKIATFGRAPNFYVVMKERTNLDIAIKKITSGHGDGKAMPKASVTCLKFLSSQFEFISWKYVEQVHEKMETLDPQPFIFQIQNRYQIPLNPSNQTRPLMKRQRLSTKDRLVKASISRISTIKKNTKRNEEAAVREARFSGNNQRK